MRGKGKTRIIGLFKGNKVDNFVVYFHVIIQQLRKVEGENKCLRLVFLCVFLFFHYVHESKLVIGVPTCLCSFRQGGSSCMYSCPSCIKEKAVDCNCRCNGTLVRNACRFCCTCDWLTALWWWIWWCLFCFTYLFT